MMKAVDCSIKDLMESVRNEKADEMNRGEEAVRLRMKMITREVELTSCSLKGILFTRVID
jgi:hypothetical protein